MPLLQSTAGSESSEIYYEVRSSAGASTSVQEDDWTNIVLIMGFGATLQCWEPQLDRLLDSEQPRATRCLLMDNRGVGRSGSPSRKSAYRTTVMAADVLAIMEHISWEHAHVVGHSMGAMVALKLAAAHPEHIDSLTLVSTTCGHLQSIPRSWRALWYSIQLMRAKEAEDRALVDLKFHFMHSTLDEVRSQGSKTGRSRWELLAEEYVEAGRGGGIGQSKMGFHGQVHAVWSHRVSQADVNTIRSGKFPVLVIHGRHDLLATPRFGEALAKRLGAPCVMLEGAHMLCRERGYHVNLLLEHIIYHAPQLVRRQHYYLDHGSGAQLETPLSRHKGMHFDVQPAPPSDAIIFREGERLSKVREGSPDSQSSANSQAQLLHG